MRFDNNMRAASALTLVVFGLSALASNFLLRLFFNLLRGPAETGLDKEVISSGALFVIAGLFGVMVAVLCFRPILNWVKERGLPFFIPEPDPFEGKHIRVGLVVSQGQLWKEVYSAWIPAHHLRTLMNGPVGIHLTVVNKERERLSIYRQRADEDEGGDEIFVVKLKKGKKVLHNLEMLAGNRGTFEVDEQKPYATCYYPLAYVGCDGTESGGWLKFGGEVRLMRLAFIR